MSKNHAAQVFAATTESVPVTTFTLDEFEEGRKKISGAGRPVTSIFVSHDKITAFRAMEHMNDFLEYNPRPEDGYLGDLFGIDVLVDSAQDPFLKGVPMQVVTSYTERLKGF